MRAKRILRVAMIPYYELKEIMLPGGHPVAVFGGLVAIGILVGAVYAERRARAVGVPVGEVPGAILSAVVPGLIVAHLVAVLPHEEAWRPDVLLRFWDGMSSFGGLAGALLGLGAYYWRVRRPWLATADLLSEALVVGWVFGRLGCTLVHDHVGRLSDSMLAVTFPDGARLDLGLVEWLYTVAVLVPALGVLVRRRRAAGTSVVVLALLYAPFRFVADFLRQTDLPGPDPRWLGLTAAQYGCLVLAGIAVAMLLRPGRERTAPTPAMVAHASKMAPARW